MLHNFFLHLICCYKTPHKCIIWYTIYSYLRPNRCFNKYNTQQYLILSNFCVHIHFAKIPQIPKIIVKDKCDAVTTLWQISQILGGVRKEGTKRAGEPWEQGWILGVFTWTWWPYRGTYNLSKKINTHVTTSITEKCMRACIWHARNLNVLGGRRTARRFRKGCTVLRGNRSEKWQKIWILLVLSQGLLSRIL